MIVALPENCMSPDSIDSWRMDLHRRVALMSDNEREWYIILTLWSPLQVIRLLEDSSERAVRLRQSSPFISLLSMPNQRGLEPDPE
jgi:hypothetical protein